MGVHAFPSLIHSKLFSKGVKFRSRDKTFGLFVFFIASTWEEVRGRGVLIWFWVRLKGAWFSVKVALCRLMWPPKACPMENSRPQIEHSWVLGLAGEPCDCPSRLPSPAINLGFLWLARWPPSAWNDGNWRLHVLHSKTRLGEVEKKSISAPRESSIKQFAMVLMLSSSASIMLLFISEQRTWQNLGVGVKDKGYNYFWMASN